MLLNNFENSTQFLTTRIYYGSSMQNNISEFISSRCSGWEGGLVVYGGRGEKAVCSRGVISLLAGASISQPLLL